MVTSFEHVGVFVKDVEASLRFYRDILGGTVVREATIPSSGTQLAYVQIGEGTVELLGPGREKSGYEHLAFQVDDLDGTHQDFVGDRIEFSVPPKTAGSGFGRIAFLWGPDRLRMELLAQPKVRKAVSELRMNPHLKGLDHVQVRVSDLDGARVFFEKHFSAQLVKDYNIRETGYRFQFMQCGEDEGRKVPLIELTYHPVWKPGDTVQLGHIALLVDDVPAATEAFQKLGADVEFGSTPMSTESARKSMLRDPDGNRVELLDRPYLKDV